MSNIPIIDDNDVNGRQILEIIFQSILDDAQPEFFNFVRDTYDMNNATFVSATKARLKKALWKTISASYILETCEGIDIVRVLEEDYRRSQNN